MKDIDKWSTRAVVNWVDVAVRYASRTSDVVPAHRAN